MEIKRESDVRGKRSRIERGGGIEEKRPETKRDGTQEEEGARWRG
jgi:hypothetical protein